MSIDNPRIALVCGMSGAGKSTLINIATGSNLAVGHGDESETSEITTRGIPLININGVYVQLVDVPGFDDTRDASDTEIYLHLTTWLSARYPGDMRVSWLIYLRPISKPRVDKLEASFIGMFKALVGEQHLDHVLLLTNRWNSPPDQGTEDLEAKLASDVKYFGTRDGKIVKTGRITGELTQDDAHRILMPLCHLPPVTLQVQHETIEEGLSALDATAGRRLNDYMRGRAPELVERAEKALKDARESKRLLENERKLAQAAQEEKNRLEAELCRREKEECERRKRERRRKRKFGNILSGVLGVAGGIIGGPVGAGVGIAAGQVAGHDDRSCSVECPHR